MIHSEESKSNISRQLWKYYDLDIDIETIRALDIKDGYYITGSTETNKFHEEFIKCKIYENGRVEDLYLIDGDKLIEPTTTKEEQEER